MSEGTAERFVDDGNRYRLDARIATGGMGEVWRATDTVLGREVAVKLLKAEYADNAASRSRFETEARHAASLHHPNVAGVYDFGEASPADGPSEQPYLVMELVDGQPLSDLLRAGQPLDPDAVRELLAQAADALGAAHVAGIVHRDVKPANMMVTPDRLVKITDFGIARAAEGVALTETGQVLGTPQYLSPEQAQGGTATPASDVYSLGVVAFECLTGHRPYVAETAVATALAHLRDPVPELPPEVPADLAAVVRKAMSKKPEDRFPDGAAFAEALRDPATAATAIVGAGAVGAGAAVVGAAGAAAAAGAADHTEVLAPAASASPTPADPAAAAASTDARRRVPWGWLLLALVVIAGLVVVAVIANGQEDDPDDPVEPRTSQAPSKSRTGEPTKEPTTAEPTQEPTTAEPSQEPTQEPSQEPTTEAPTSEAPTEEPTSEEPSESPSQQPTSSPATPSSSPATQQSATPTQSPRATQSSVSTQQEPQ